MKTTLTTLIIACAAPIAVMAVPGVPDNVMSDITENCLENVADDDQETALSPFTIDSNTTKVDTRARGRYANIKIENTGVAESWRFGTFQVDLQPDGRRG